MLPIVVATHAPQPRRYLDGSVIPPELLELTPPDPPVSFIGGLDHIRTIAVEVFSQLPTLEHAVLIVDVLGGVHAVRCFEESRGLRLPEVADRVIIEVEDLPYPMSLLYLTRGRGFPADASTQWNELLWRHAGPPFLADAVVVAAHGWPDLVVCRTVRSGRVRSLGTTDARDAVP